MSSAVHTHYQNLSVSESSPIEVITASFQALLAKYSEELYPGDTEAARIRAVLQASYAVLSSAASRRDHDEWIQTKRTELGAAHRIGESVNASGAVPASSTTASIYGGAVQNVGATISSQSINSSQKQSSEGVKTLLPWAVGIGGVILFLVWQSNQESSRYTVPATTAAPTPRSTNTQSMSASKPPAVVPTAPVQPELTKTVTSVPFSPDFGTAAITTNLRSGATAKSRIMRPLERGTLVQRMSVDGTFVKVQLADETVGWIAEELLLPSADIGRLSTVTPDAYVSARKSEDRIGQVERALKPLIDRDLRRIVGLAQNREQEVLGILKTVATEKITSPVPDDAAANWYTLAATAARNNGDIPTALSNYQAALVAAPAVGANHSAVALAAYEIGDNKLLVEPAVRALMLAPESTNACLVFALALATLSTADRPRERSASGAILLALTYSRDVEFTKKYLRALASKAENPIVKRVIETALYEAAGNPQFFK